MNTYNLNIDECYKNQFPIDLIFIGNQIYKGIRNLAKTTAGVIIILPLCIALIIMLPITYLLIGIVFIYYIFGVKKITNRMMKVVVTKDNYTALYDLYLYCNKTNSRLEIIENRSKTGAKGLLLKPVLLFIKKWHTLLIKVNNHLESQLFEPHNPSEISKEDIEFFKSQLKTSKDDWDDDGLWKDFQTKHHHLTN